MLTKKIFLHFPLNLTPSERYFYVWNKMNSNIIFRPTSFCFSYFG